MARWQRWALAVLLGTAVFAAAWWFCEAALDKSSGDAIGIAAIPSAMAAMVAAWWAGLSSPADRDRAARTFWVRRILTVNRAELDQVFAVAPRLPLVLLGRPDVASFGKTGFAAREFADVGAAFDGAGRAMLLLGAGGGGKSTLLTELCVRLCEAEQDRDGPVVPVVVTPGTWTGGRLENWLPGAVADSYPGLSPAVARKWVAARAVVLLVDALEDAGARKADFLKALDKFLGAGACPVVVACREEDFEGLDAPAAIGLAVQVRTPSRDEAVAYLRALGNPAADSVVAVSEKDSQWWSMVREPLMLGAIATLAAIAPTKPLRLARHKDRRRQVLNLYVDALIARGGRPPGATGDDDARRWLAWLAAWMSAHSAREFHVDRVPASWLPAVLAPRDNANLVNRASRALTGAALGVLVGGVVVTANAAALRSLPQLVLHSFVVLFATYHNLRVNHLVPGEPIRLTWRVRGRWPVALGITGLLVYTGSVLLAAAQGTSPVSVPVVATTGAVLVYATPVVLALTVRSVAESNRARTAPGVRLRRSLVNAWRAALLIGVPVTAVRFALTAPVAGLEYAVVFCLPLAVLNIGSSWLVFGGMPVLQYHLLFRKMARQGRGPRHYVEFLRWAVENRLLRPAGSAVRFPHREIQRHLQLTWRG
ncbi:hypothetical protein [Actinokineospora sp. NBRC 105648]|uniref:hypothetical protein n=1 Tax=Actinokineospora sp. NBRC 105648 TaxID=3032206 RepID=UPI0024A0813D|nr:hypothetical protein [Actinokineospora sp. NBRC 105648]GLZ36576.1 hypothetical protein Acsp05_02010 [Actinokineospora sp. NBRC 105648]